MHKSRESMDEQQKAQIKENNILIARFMGIDESIPHDHQGIYLYHSSWDWLMPVMEKIWNLTGHRNLWYIDLSEIDPNGFISILYNKFHIREDSFKNNIEEVYGMVITFIKWYNKNKQ